MTVCHGYAWHKTYVSMSQAVARQAHIKSNSQPLARRIQIFKQHLTLGDVARNVSTDFKNK